MHGILSWSGRIALMGMVIASARADHGCDFGPARNLGAVNSAGFEGSPTVTSDETSLFFTSDRGGQEDLYVSTRQRRGAPWGEPRSLGPVVNDPVGDDFSLRIAPDGRSLYFASNRPGGHGKGDMYVATRSSPRGAFTRVENLGPPLNTGMFEAFPTPGPDGNTLYFNRSTGFDSADSDIWVSTRSGRQAAWGEPRRLPAPVNSDEAEFSPSLSPDARTLFFASARPGNIGAFGIWVTTRARVTDPWGPPFNLGPNVNTASGATLAPFLTRDGRSLYFMSARPESVGTAPCDSPVCFARFDLYVSTCR